MKRYIRTKDGKIFDTVKDLGRYGKSKAVIICDFNGNFIDVRKQNMILKKADTIEELCDVIVCRNELFYPLTSNREGNEFNWEEINRFRTSVCIDEEEYNKIKETTNDFEPYFYKVFGAIWTDKGLIYVAKMNDKGELELI